MDPNETLDRLRELFADVDMVSVEDRASIAEEAAQTFADLDAWLASGGFIPERWSR